MMVAKADKTELLARRDQLLQNINNLQKANAQPVVTDALDVESLE